METNLTEKNECLYLCKKCNFKCFYKSDYNRHILTAKHKMETYGNKNYEKNESLFLCYCGKKYSSRSGLWKHKKSCSLINKSDDKTIVKYDNKNDNSNILDVISQNKEIVDLLVLQNEELKRQNREQSTTIRELIPKIGNNNTTTNNNNNQLNLQVFLNEDCKDAINFSDFIKQIQVSFEDLENQAENGYVKGISKLFIENLQGLGTNKRPIHCTDKKRKTLYIKENDEWDKEGSQDTLIKGIQEVTRSTMRTLIKEKEEKSEEYSDMDSEFSMKCIDIQRNLFPTAPRETSFGKVMENITKNSGIIQ